MAVTVIWSNVSLDAQTRGSHPEAGASAQADGRGGGNDVPFAAGDRHQDQTSILRRPHRPRPEGRHSHQAASPPRPSDVALHAAQSAHLLRRRSAQQAGLCLVLRGRRRADARQHPRDACRCCHGVPPSRTIWSSASAAARVPAASKLSRRSVPNRSPSICRPRSPKWSSLEKSSTSYARRVSRRIIRRPAGPSRSSATSTWNTCPRQLLHEGSDW